MTFGDGTATPTGGAPSGIVTIGEILVEIMALETGHGFREPIRLVGGDDFALVNLERLAADGVDVSAIETDPTQATATAFVRYRPDGDRDFVYNIRHSACGQTRLTEQAAALLRRSTHLHVMGSSLASERIIAETKTAIGIIKGQGGTVSFDPNIRREMLGAPGIREALGR
jgi:sugar/nucleoside kinase (ribokinase family)